MTDNVPIDVIRDQSPSPNLIPPSLPKSASVRKDRGQPQTSGPEHDVPPDGGYRAWTAVGCTALINAHTWGINSSYGVFLSYYLSHNIYPNTSALTYAFIGGLSISQAMLIAPLSTWVVRRFGTRVCLHVGILFETTSLIGASFAKTRWQIILSQGLAFGYGMGFLFVGSVGITAQWFLKRRSLANAIASSGSGAGGLTYSLATQAMIDSLGLGWAFRILGIVSCVVNLICANLLRDRNVQVGARHRAFDVSLLKRPEFCLLEAWSIFSMLGYVVVLFSLPSYAASVGLSAQQGSVIAALMSTGIMVSRPAIGLLSDRFGRLNLAFLLTLSCFIFCLAFWIPATGMGLLSFFAIIGGGITGSYWGIISPVCAEVIGLRDLPAGLSITWVAIVPPTTVAEAIALELRRPGSNRVYLDVQLFTAFMYLGGALCIWLVRAWKVGEIEETQKVKRDIASNASISGNSTETREVEKVGNVEVEADTIRKRSWKSWDLIRRLWTFAHV